VAGNLDEKEVKEVIGIISKSGRYGVTYAIQI
jgi:hypothetical protein